MKKKLMSLLILTSISITGLASCGSSSTDSGDGGSIYKIGMSTDSGTIDDKSFNQGTWEGIEKYKKDTGKIDTKYLQPSGETKADYLSSIDTLVNGGYKMVVMPGFKFNSAVNEAQTTYPDTKFVIIDGQPADDSGNSTDIAKNTLSIYFTEQEPGFYAGVVAALTTKTNKVGFIGGMEIPAVQKYGWGFVAGVAYANKTYGRKAEVTQYTYQGTFNDTVGGKTLAGNYYDQGIDIIFCAAGGVGVGAIDEAKTRKTQGKDIWIIGVDSDQYKDGVYDEANNKSCILTSALKNLQQAAYDAIDDEINGEFKGGKSEILSSKDNAVKLPDTNPNMSDDVYTKYQEVFEKVKDGTIVVPSTSDDLKTFLNDQKYTTPSSVKKY